MDKFRITVSTELRNAILQTAAYADVFDYPLTAAEIHRYLIFIKADKNEVEQALQDGTLLRWSDGYYTLPNREGLVRVRHKREQVAKQMWPLATGYGRVIAGLPFVRMVAVTGSLAINNVDRFPDIDYLIVTARRRLWMVRAMALAVVRAAALRGVRLCPNYLVSEDALIFPSQTLYAAHELAQMVPIFGLDVYLQIYQLNSWVDNFLPNAYVIPPVTAQVANQRVESTIKRLCEKALLLPPGEWFEHWEMRRKLHWLSREQSDSPESCFAADYCKGHNLQHGQRTEHALRERLEGLRLEAPV